jgi:hypothetical protein
MRRILVPFLAALLLLIPTTSTAGVNPYLSAPANKSTIEQTIKNATAIITISGAANTTGFTSTGLAFAGNFNLESSFTNQGFNSLLITNNSLLSKNNDPVLGCFARNGSFTVTANFLDSKYEAKCWAWNSDGTDFASIATRVKMPTIPLYDNYQPPIGGWVDVEYYIDGVGIVFKESKVQYIDKKNWVLGIEKIIPNPVNGGLVFNSLGNFMGSLTTFGPGVVPGDYLKVVGAPNLCLYQGATATIVNCSVSAPAGQGQRDYVWTVSSESVPSPAPSPTQVVAPASQAIIDAVQEATNSGEDFNRAVDNCENAISGLSSEIFELISQSRMIGKCHQFDSQEKSLLSNSDALLARGKNISDLQQITTLVNQVNAITDKINGFIDLLDSLTSNQESFQSEFAKFDDNYQSTKEDLDVRSSKFETIATAISQLPNSIKQSLKNSQKYKNLVASDSKLLDSSSKISAIAKQLSSISTAEEIVLLNKKLQLLLASSQINAFDAQLNQFLKTAPKIYCASKGVNSIPSPNSTCSKGAIRNTISYGS